MPATLAAGSERVRLRLYLEVRGSDADGREFCTTGATAEIHRDGALLELPAAAGRIAPGQQLTLRRKHGEDCWLEARVRVLGLVNTEHEARLYNVEMLESMVDFWAIEFPQHPRAGSAVACMLLECCFCRRREVVYVNERDMLCFNTQKGIARPCEACEMPTIWIQTLDEDPAGAGALTPRQVGLPTQPDHRQAAPRFQTRLTACIRAAGAEPELAVCENMSRGGLCFRARRPLRVDDILEVAVPYARNAANIFVPARVVYVQEVPGAGLYRHGAAYLRMAVENGE
jgi:hypothetical protein